MEKVYGLLHLLLANRLIETLLVKSEGLPEWKFPTEYVSSETIAGLQ